MAALQRPALPLPRPLARPRSAKLWIAAAGALVVAVALIQVNQFSRVTSTGYEIDALSRQRADKLAANQDLEAKVAQLSSLARVDLEARTRLGMQPAAKTLYIDVNATVPGQQSLPTRYLPRDPAPDPPATEGESKPLWKRLLDKLPF